MAFEITLNGQVFPDFRLAFNLTDTVSDIDAVIGLAVTQDTSAAESVKIATDGDEILGRLFMVEDRTEQGGSVVATVETKGGYKLAYADGQSISVGDMVVGAAGGKVRKKTTGDTAVQGLRVWAVDTTNKTVTVCVL